MPTPEENKQMKTTQEQMKVIQGKLVHFLAETIREGNPTHIVLEVAIATIGKMIYEGAGPDIFLAIIQDLLLAAGVTTHVMIDASDIVNDREKMN